MHFETLKIPGRDAIRLLNEHRSLYAATGRYPFLVGDVEELKRMNNVTPNSDWEHDEPTATGRRPAQELPIGIGSYGTAEDTSPIPSVDSATIPAKP